ncbi:MAG: alpha/beta fold hydrolase [Methyloligellaceae bacterium]
MVLVSIARNPVPTDAISGHFKGYDGQPIRYAYWKTTSGGRKGTVCLFTGRSEFIEKYYEVIADLRRRGFSVATMDWRGQGGSVRVLRNSRKGYIRKFEEYEADVHNFMKQIVLPDCPPPYFALAHSMGGHVILRMGTARNCWFDRMVLNAPMFEFSEKQLPFSFGMVKGVMETMSLLGMGDRYVAGGSDRAWDEQPYEKNPLTSDRGRYDRSQAILKSAPELGLGSPTVAWMRSACRSIVKIRDPLFPNQIQVPVLIIGAGDDDVVSTRATEDMSVRLKVGSHLVIPQARHEIMQERDELRLQFWAAFDAFVPGSKDIPIYKK